jgi:ABC-type sugar transport system ATPase subunit
MNFLEARREDGWWVSADGSRIAEAASGPPGLATIGFRPEHAAPDGGPFEAAVEVIEDLGPARVLVLRRGETKMRLLVDRSWQAPPGTILRPRVAREHVLEWREAGSAGLMGDER